jgi:GTP-binding protein YchF
MEADMSVAIGIIGLAQSGKTTVFSTLCGLSSDHTGATSNVGVTKVPDPRLKILSDLLHPQKVVSAEVQFSDIGAATRGMADGRGIGGQYLLELSHTDALIAVVRAFTDDTIPHPEGSLDIHRDITAINLELAFVDLAIIERRLKKIDDSMKGAKPPERQQLLREKDHLAGYQAKLENDVPLRDTPLTPADAGLIANYQFLTAKPLLIIVNLSDDQIAGAADLETELNPKYQSPNCRIATLCGKLEMELAQLDEATATAFRTEYGIEQSGRDRVITLAYETLGLLTFFTTASDELKAWPVPGGTTALKAAGKIHSDMERGFIRAEVISYQDLLDCGSLTEARHRGQLRLEGKDYAVREGDVITFLFNV